MTMKKFRGFTLVEMLIVIAIIGVLAVAVLSAINPVEQMRKARDTRRRGNAAELLNAMERYYANNEEYGDDLSTAVEDATDCDDIMLGTTLNSLDLGDLVSSDEIKAEFVDRIEDEANYLYAGIDYAGGSELARVCYQIESSANIEKYSGYSCDPGGTGDWFICLPE